MRCCGHIKQSPGGTLVQTCPWLLDGRAQHRPLGCPGSGLCVPAPLAAVSRGSPTAALPPWAFHTQPPEPLFPAQATGMEHAQPSPRPLRSHPGCRKLPRTLSRADRKAKLGLSQEHPAALPSGCVLPGWHLPGWGLVLLFLSILLPPSPFKTAQVWFSKLLPLSSCWHRVSKKRYISSLGTAAGNKSVTEWCIGVGMSQCAAVPMLLKPL